MLRRSPLRPASVLLAALALTTLAACDHGDDESVASVGDGADDLADAPTPAEKICLELACADDQVCVIPPLHCDDSGDTPQLRRDDPFCRPIAASAGVVVDAEVLTAVASPYCPDAQLVGDGVASRSLYCPDLDVVCD
ncbi:MAG: hypothetical protein KC486_15615 [Myxococcales bacterium]|nr:hypothetical protein [Myxococcales bacterium]